MRWLPGGHPCIITGVKKIAAASGPRRGECPMQWVAFFAGLAVCGGVMFAVWRLIGKIDD